MSNVISFDRQHLLMDPVKARDTTVSVIGCGTVGSNAAVELARLGIGGFELWDDDSVESHNLPSQRFVKGDLGRLKTDATRDRVLEVSDIARVSTRVERIAGPVMLAGSVVVLAVDSMSARECISRVLASSGVGLVMDFRMSANVLQVYSFAAGDERYAGTLFSDDDADPVPCGGRTVSYTGALAGCLAGGLVRKFLMDGEVPFLVSVDLGVFDMLTV